MYNSNGTLKPLIKIGLFLFGIFIIMSVVQYFFDPTQNIQEEKTKVTLVSNLSLQEVEKPIGEIDVLNFQSNMWKSNLKSATETYSLVENYNRNLNKLYVLKNGSSVPVKDVNDIFANLESHHIDDFRCYSSIESVYCIYSSPTGWTSSSDWTTFTSDSTDFKVYKILDDKLSYIQTIQSKGQSFPQLLTSNNKTYASFGNSVYYLKDKDFVPVTGIDYERINKNFGLNPDVQYVNGEWFLVFDGSLIDNNSEVYVLHDNQSLLFDELSSNRYVDFFSVDNDIYVKVNKVTSGFCGDDPCYKTTYFQIIKAGQSSNKNEKAEIDESTEISGLLQGYYYTYTSSGEYVDVPFSEKCEAFVVVKGNDKNGDLLLNYFSGLVKQGNTVSKLSKTNELIINLNTEDLNKLNQTDKESLKNSSIDNQVSIQVKKIKEEAKEAKPCHSFFNLQDVTVN